MDCTGVWQLRDRLSLITIQSGSNLTHDLIEEIQHSTVDFWVRMGYKSCIVIQSSVTLGY